MDCSLLGSSVHGIFQARILEWVAIFFFRESSRPKAWTLAGRVFTTEPPGKPYLILCMCAMLSCVWLFVALCTIASQAPLSMEFFRQDTGVAFHFLLQVIFLTLQANPCLLYCRQISFLLSHWIDDWFLSALITEKYRCENNYNVSYEFFLLVGNKCCTCKCWSWFIFRN